MSSSIILEHIFRGTDCIFIFPDNDEKCAEIHANRHVIDNTSALLKAKFETYKRNYLVIHNVKQSVFKVVLQHVYTGSFPEMVSQETLFDMYDAAKKYEFKETIDSIIRRIIKECKIEKMEELLSYLNFALKNYIVDIQSALKDLIECNADLIFLGEKFLNAHPRVLNWIFSLNDLNIDEWMLIDIVDKYKSFHNSIGRQGIFSQIQPAINNIRFLSMTVQQIIDTTFLSDDEKNCLIQVINQEVSDNSVPINFSRRRIGRCYKSQVIICEDSRLEKLYDEKKIKMCTFKERKYFADEDGKIVASIEDSGNVVPFEFEELTPIKWEHGRPKKPCTGIQNTVLYYKENKQIMVKKEKQDHEKDRDGDKITVSLGKLSLKKT